MRTDADVELLERPPAIGPLIAKAAAQTALKRNKGSVVPELPRRRIMLAEQSIDIQRLADYARVCDLPLRNDVPGTYLHVLTFPTQVHLMAADDFPFQMAGTVHIRNEMTMLRPVDIAEKVTVSSWAEHLQPHPRGASVDLMGQATVGDEVVWQGTSTYLVRGASAEGEAEPALDDSASPSTELNREAGNSENTSAESLPLPQWALWRCPADLGRRYAAASGDVNPIHLNPLAAKALGFPRTIAHGMWTHAKALAAMQGRVPSRHTVSVEFHKPILLPSNVVFRARGTEGGFVFAVTDRAGHREHVIGSIRSA